MTKLGIFGMFPMVAFRGNLVFGYRMREEIVERKFSCVLTEFDCANS